jgi:hypothetical protein
MGGSLLLHLPLASANRRGNNSSLTILDRASNHMDSVNAAQKSWKRDALLSFMFERAQQTGNSCRKTAMRQRLPALWNIPAIKKAPRLGTVALSQGKLQNSSMSPVVPTRMVCVLWWM